MSTYEIQLAEALYAGSTIAPAGNIGAAGKMLSALKVSVSDNYGTINSDIDQTPVSEQTNR